MQYCRSLLVAVLLAASACWSQASALESFVLLYGQVTNDIAFLRQNFDSAPQTRQKLAAMVRVRDVILDPAHDDANALAALVPLLAPYSDFAGLLDTGAEDVRAGVLREYQALGDRVALLPPSVRTTRARQRYNSLATLAAALAGAQHAAGISAQLQPLTRALVTARDLANRAAILPRPSIRLNQVRATINRRAFVSIPPGQNSPTILQVTVPTPLYRDLYCRAVDSTKVLAISLPVVTTVSRCEVEQGLAAVAFEADVFATNRTILNASSGTFWVQSTPTEVYGYFSCTGPGLTVTNGQFRIQVRSTNR